jgi:hypothetical protein
MNRSIKGELKMKVKDLIKLLQAQNQEAYVQIKTDNRWAEDVIDVYSIDKEDCEVVYISSILPAKN